MPRDPTHKSRGAPASSSSGTASQPPRAPRSVDATKLGKYRGKRAPGITNEPFGDEALGDPAASTATESGSFVVHLHDATRRHYDLRLEMGGVLMSFAVPRGPSLDPKEKVLAVKTEDHPLEYIEFEDVIPPGQYGAGSMILWDRGAVAYVEGPAEAELAQGKLHVELRGLKLRGRWAFVKLAKSATGNDWLLFKKQDEHANPSRDILRDLPRSVLSGLTVEELERREAIAEARYERARSLGAKPSAAVAALFGSGAPPATSPLIQPTAGPLEAEHGVVYDPELEGVRVLATRDGDVVALRRPSTDGEERVEAFYPDVVRALRALPSTRLALDGELVAFDASGYPSLPLLAQRARRVAKGETHRAVTTTPVVLVVTDVLAVGDLDTRPLPLEARRQLVTELVPELGFVRAATPLEGDEARVISTCAALGIAGVIAKARRSPYTRDQRVWALLSTGIAPRSRAVVDHGAQDATTALRKVAVTNKDKIFWPEEGYTKGDLVDYYASVADVALPYLKARPVILVRYPDGIEGKSFYQWNVPVGMPPWVRTMTLHELEDHRAIADAPPPSAPPRSRRSASSAEAGPPPSTRDKTPKRVFLVDDASTLVYIANLGCIPLHVLASRAPDLTRADFATIDFDVKQSELRHAVTLAQTLHELLDAIGLPGYPKTSGQTGLHVLVPLGKNQTFETARALADLLGRLLVERHPDIATMERVIQRRGPRVYVDTGQTGTSRAIVAPYSVRAVRGATVSTPLTWDEVTPDLDPRAYTIRTVPARIAKRGDLLAGLLDAELDVPRAVARLAEIVARPA